MEKLKLGEKIKQEAKKKGFTQEQVGIILGKSQGAIAKIYKKNDMQVSDLKKLCKALGISFNRIVKESDI